MRIEGQTGSASMIRIEVLPDGLETTRACTGMIRLLEVAAGLIDDREVR